MVIDIERQKVNFKDHVASFTDYGNIKILDFKKPDSSHYRIRFLFEEDYYRLHISGDLGELIASNYKNMVYEEFSDFVNDVGYFEGKIDCHSRDIYEYDEDDARKELKERFKEYDYISDTDLYKYEDDDDERLEYILDDIFEDFDSKRGIGSKGYDVLSEIDPDAFEYAWNLGKEETGILNLYMLAFKLAQEQLKGMKNESIRINK